MVVNGYGGAFSATVAKSGQLRISPVRPEVAWSLTITRGKGYYRVLYRVILVDREQGEGVEQWCMLWSSNCPTPIASTLESCLNP